MTRNVASRTRHPIPCAPRSNRNGAMFGGLIALIVWIAFSSSSEAQHIDALLYRQDHRLLVGGFDFGATPSVLTDYRVFHSELEEIVPFPGVRFTGSPGWNALTLPDELPAGTQTLPGNRTILLAGPALPSLLSGRNLAYWSGDGDPRFTSVPDGEVLTHSIGNRQATYDGSTSAATQLTFGETNPGGGMHLHPSYALYGNRQLSASSEDSPSRGIYLIAVEAHIESLTAAPPIFALFGNGVDSFALTRAEHYVRTAIVPEPGCGIILSCGILVAASRQRRR